MKIPKALTIAGSDSGGGAGIQADLKTFAALGVHGSSVITAITAQNTKEVRAVHNVPLEIITAQIDAIFSDIGADVVKIGMLSNAEIIKTVVASLKKYKIKKIVLDPVMIAESGARLIEIDAVDSLIKQLIPLSTIVTPNIHEAEILAGVSISSIDDVKKAAKIIHGFGCSAILIKGGHLPGKEIQDLLYDGKKFIILLNKRLPKRAHGTGCTLSSAIAAYLAKGQSLEESVKQATTYVHHALSEGYQIGSKNIVLKHI